MTNPYAGCIPEPPSQEVPIYFPVDSPKNDPLVLHSDVISQESVGDFCGTPIKAVDTLDQEVLEERDRRQLIVQGANTPAKVFENVDEHNVIQGTATYSSRTEIVQDCRLWDRFLYLLNKNGQWAVSVVTLDSLYTPAPEVGTEQIDNIEHYKFASQTEAEDYFITASGGKIISLEEAKHCPAGATVLWRPMGKNFALLWNDPNAEFAIIHED